MSESHSARNVEPAHCRQRILRTSDFGRNVASHLISFLGNEKRDEFTTMVPPCAISMARTNELAEANTLGDVQGTKKKGRRARDRDEAASFAPTVSRGFTWRRCTLSRVLVTSPCRGFVTAIPTSIPIASDCLAVRPFILSLRGAVVRLTMFPGHTAELQSFLEEAASARSKIGVALHHTGSTCSLLFFVRQLSWNDFRSWRTVCFCKIIFESRM